VTDGRHGVAEDTSLQLHRAVAERLRAEPPLVERARRRVEDWVRDGTAAEPAGREPRPARTRFSRQPEGLGCAWTPSSTDGVWRRGRETSQRAEIVLRGQAAQQADAAESFDVGGGRGNAPLEVDLRAWQ
jgi:hypothetical protein